MIGMDAFIVKLYRGGEISMETALRNASNPEMVQRQILR